MRSVFNKLLNFGKDEKYESTNVCLIAFTTKGLFRKDVNKCWTLYSNYCNDDENDRNFFLKKILSINEESNYSMNLTFIKLKI